MVSVIDICNRALIKVDGNTITSLDQNIEEAVKCKILYPQIRDEVLREHFWNFAIKQATLQQSTLGPEFEFDYKYALPSDYIRIYRLKNRQNRYKVKGRFIHTNLSSLLAEYVSRETDTTKFDPMFVTCLVLRLAAELAYPIAGSSDRAEVILKEYESFLKKAKRADGQEGTPDSLTAELFVDSRHGYGDINSRDWSTI